MKAPLKNRSKEDIKAEIARTNKVKHERELALKIWEHIKGMKSIYDAQTALQAVSGFVTFEYARKTQNVLCGDLTVDLKREKDKEMKKIMEAILVIIKGENAKDTAGFLERYGKMLAMYSSMEYMKKPMSELNRDKIIL